MQKVYPRVCGGTGCGRNARPAGQGLSPRVRGNLVGARRAVKALRSIPACAGEPRWAKPVNCGPKVYPRVCGGTDDRHAKTIDLNGLSPRVRGNPAVRARDAAREGSIPACAGEPIRTRSLQNLYEVYPRVCGGTRITRRRIRPRRAGLSPRVRGNRAGIRRGRCRPGSIPACAGEPAKERLYT